MPRASRLWQLGGDSPYRGRELRGLLHAAGFEAVSATTRAIPYRTDTGVRAFGRDRAEQARGGGFVEAELAAMAEGWLEWSEAPLASSRCGQRHGEDRTAGLAVDGHGPMMGFHHGGDDGQAEARTAGCAGT